MRQICTVTTVEPMNLRYEEEERRGLAGVTVDGAMMPGCV